MVTNRGSRGATVTCPATQEKMAFFLTDIIRAPAAMFSRLGLPVRRAFFGLSTGVKGHEMHALMEHQQRLGVRLLYAHVQTP